LLPFVKVQSLDQSGSAPSQQLNLSVSWLSPKPFRLRATLPVVIKNIRAPARSLH